MTRIRTLAPDQISEVSDFVDFLADKARRQALVRLLAMASELDAAGAAEMTEAEITAFVAAEIAAYRQERRALA